jgi:hypothetical protein
LKSLAAAGAEYLVLPCSQFGWLENDAALNSYVRRRHRQIVFQPNVCAIFALKEKPRTARRSERNDSSSNRAKTTWRAAKAMLARKG